MRTNGRWRRKMDTKIPTKKKKKSPQKKQHTGFRRIGTKLYALVALLAIVGMAAMLYLAGVLVDLSESNREIITREAADIEEISAIGREFSYINGQVMIHVLTTREQAMDEAAEKVNAKLADLDTRIESFDARLSEEDERREAFGKLEANYIRYKDTVAHLLETSKVNKSHASKTATSSLSVFGEDTELYINTILEQTDARLDECRQQVQSYERQIPFAIGASCVLLLLTVVIIVIMTQQGVIRPLRKVTKQLRKIMGDIAESKGDLTVRIQVKSKDEIGQLAGNINAFLELFQSIIAGIIHSCEVLSNQREKVGSNVSQAEQGADDTSATFEELAAGMAEVSANVSTVGGNTRDVENSVEAMAREVEAGSRYAESIKEKADAVERQAVESRQEVNDLVSHIGETVAKSVEESRQVTRITELTEEILGIANKTNLLAINASIEAARAGEAGKGFAVVADEVRKLADNSRSTAGNIQEISAEVVDSVEELAANASRLLEFVNSRVLADYAVLEETGAQYATAAATIDGIMEKFRSASGELLEVVKNVTSANERITNTVGESADGVNSVVDNTVQLAGGMKEISAALTGVNQVVGELLDSVGYFIKY